MAFEIVVAQPVHAPVLDVLHHHGSVVMNPGPGPYSADELVRQCRNADALMAFMTERIDQSFVEQCPRLKIIAGALKGYNNIDVRACSQHGIAVTIVPDLLTEPTAELAVGLMISIAREIRPADAHVRSGEFAGWRTQFFGDSVVGSTVAVIGAGAVGQAVMRMLGGFGCNLLYVDKRALPSDKETALNCRRVGLADALPRADFIVLALHLTEETLHLVDDDFLRKMKTGSYLINPARGSLVDERAVAAALERGYLAGYAADTFEMEDWARVDRPQEVPGALLNANHTILTPHIGSAVRKVREEIELSAAQSIIEVAKGRVPDTAVNRIALKSE